MTEAKAIEASSTPPILVIGATGKTGRRIVRNLVERGHSVRGVSRRSDPPFDWDRPATWLAALRGVRAAYIAYSPDLAMPGAPAIIQALVARAAEAGVERLVLLSGRGEHNAERCETIVRESGLKFTLLRASWFFQNFDEGQLLAPVRSGLIAMPASSVREPFIDVGDIAEVAAEALIDDRHSGRLYELTGPRLLSFGEAAAEIAKAAGYPVQYTAVSLEEFRAGVEVSAGPAVAALLTELCREVFDGRNASLGCGVQEALGREPRDFVDYCRAVGMSGAWRR